MNTPSHPLSSLAFSICKPTASAPHTHRFSNCLMRGLLVAGLIGTQPASAEPLMHVVKDAASGQCVIRQGDTNVLQYNHQSVTPSPEVLAKIAAGNQKYARPRSNYIHPLYGPSGEVLTTDWAVDHPHHRGIYWAWPEVMFNGQTGDLHALQRVFARPLGQPVTSHGEDAATIEAENNWIWEDKTPIVYEKVKIRAEKAGPHGRRIDLTITLVARVDGVSIARRETINYGGLNTRLGAATALAIRHHADATGTDPRMAWHQATGTWGGAPQAASLTIFEKAANPGYPADHIEYPPLAWLQPAFPKAGQRQALNKGEALVLQFRVLIGNAAATDEKVLRQEWRIFNEPPAHP